MYPEKHKHALVMFFISILILTVGLPGCKEGTDKTPVSTILTRSEITEPSIDFYEKSSNNPVASIQGTVKNLRNDNLTNIEVKLYYEGQHVLTTRTTSEGKFFIENLPKGLYDLAVAENDHIYKHDKLVIQILENGTKSPEDLDFVLFAKPQ